MSLPAPENFGTVSPVEFDDVQIDSVRKGFTWLPEVRAEMERIERAISDPQDLEDGLLAVAHDQALRDATESVQRAADEAVMTSLMGPIVLVPYEPPFDLPA